MLFRMVGVSFFFLEKVVMNNRRGDRRGVVSAFEVSPPSDHVIVKLHVDLARVLGHTLEDSGSSNSAIIALGKQLLNKTISFKKSGWDDNYNEDGNWDDDDTGVDSN